MALYDLRCILSPWFSFLSNDTPNYMVQKQKNSLVDLSYTLKQAILLYAQFQNIVAPVYS